MRHSRMISLWALCRLILFLFLASILIPETVDAGKASRSYHPRSSYKSSKSYRYSRPSLRSRHYKYSSRLRYHTTHRSRSIASPYATRDSHGRIKRSESAKRKFMRMTGYPHGRPGYVVDHVVPLSKGGRDDPGNMQWQTKEEAKAKDKWERRR